MNGDGFSEHKIDINNRLARLEFGHVEVMKALTEIKLELTRQMVENKWKMSLWGLLGGSLPTVVILLGLLLRYRGII